MRVKIMYPGMGVQILAYNSAHLWANQLSLPSFQHYGDFLVLSMQICITDAFANRIKNAIPTDSSKTNCYHNKILVFLPISK